MGLVMKLRFLLALLLLPLMAHGANPAFQDFATNQFNTTGNKVVAVQGRTLFVDSVYGNNAAGGRQGKPFRDIAWAKTNAQAGDLIVVRPGNYTNNNLGKKLTSLYYNFEPGAKLYYRQPGGDEGYGFVDDRATGATTNYVLGHGEFYMDFNEHSSAFGAFVVSHPGSVMVFNGRLLSGTDLLGQSGYLVWATNGTTFVDFDVLTDPNLATSLVGGIFWGHGNIWVNVKSNYVSGLALWGDSPGTEGSAHDLYYTGEFLWSQRSQAYYLLAVNPNYRAWLQIRQIGTSGDANAMLLSGGKTYLNGCQKVSSTGSSEDGTISLSGASTNWLQIEKISGGSLPAISFQGDYDGRSTFTVQEIEDTGSMTVAVDATAGGEIIINDAQITMNSAAGIGVMVGSTNTLRLNNVRIKTRGTTNNWPIFVRGGSAVVELQNCFLESPSGTTNSIFATNAQTVTVLGSLTTSTNENGLVTFNTGTMARQPTGGKWVTPSVSGAAPGTNTMVFFNDAGVLGAVATFTFDKIEGILRATDLAVSSITNGEYFGSGAFTNVGISGFGSNIFVTGSGTFSQPISVMADQDSTNVLGRALIHTAFTDYAMFAHFDKPLVTDFAIAQTPAGLTLVNASSGQEVRIQIQNATQWTVDASGDFLAGTDDTDYIGLPSSGRPKGINVGTHGITNAGAYRVSGTAGPTWSGGAGAPAIAAPLGSLYSRTDGGAGTSLYVKESDAAGTGGWVGK